MLKDLKLKNPDKVLIWQININSLSNKLEFLTNMIRDKVYLLMISKIILNSSFSGTQFYMTLYSKRYSLGRNSKNGVIFRDTSLKN